MKRIISGLLILMLVGLMPNFTVNVSANSIMDKVINEETEETHSEDTSYSKLRGNLLNFGTVGITKLSSNEINIDGLTQGHIVCGTVYLTMVLERKVNGSYSTYKTLEFEKNSASSLHKSYNIVVPSGYYYRVRGYHAAKDSGVKESTTTLTSGILVK